MDLASGEPAPTPETIARALNEQGFLFQNRIVGLTWDAHGASKWRPEAFEYPVSIGVLFDETRIDLILRSTVPGQTTWFATLECKRADPRFKTWIFFEKRNRLLGAKAPAFFFSAAEYDATEPGAYQDGFPALQTRVIEIENVTGIPLLSFYLEAKEACPPKPKDGSQAKTPDKLSSTSTIEDAFRQASLGVVGLAPALARAEDHPFRAVPIVVTTAAVFEADYDAADISIDRGMIDAAKLRLTAHPWLAVNYAISDKIAGLRDPEPSAGDVPAIDLGGRLLRTMFVVRANRLMDFLATLRREFAEKNPPA